MALVSDIELRRSSLPLARPYRLSFGTLHSFEALAVRLRLSDGAWGVGQAVPLPGYGWEDAEQAEALLSDLARESLGRPADQLWPELLERQPKRPMSLSPLLCALEVALQGWPWVAVPLRVKLTRLWDPLSHPHPPGRGEGALSLKIKLGSAGVEQDLRMLSRVAGLDLAGCRLRLDANQAYDLDQALAVGRAMEGLPVEFFEQPLPRDQWEQMSELTGRLKVPTLLDEAIWTPQDVQRAIDTRAASGVKLKLIKCGSLGRTLEMARQALGAGLKVVLGNGVAGPLECHQEAVLHGLLGLETAGEMNGLLKLKQQPGGNGLRVREGLLEITSWQPACLPVF